MFSTILCAFATTGTIAYFKTETLAQNSRTLAGRGGRLIASMEMTSAFLHEVAAEKDNDMAVSDQDVVKFVAETRKHRAETYSKIDQIDATTPPRGKELMKALRESLGKRVKIEEQILEGGILNSNNHADAYWTTEGDAAQRPAFTAMDASLVVLDKVNSLLALKAENDLREAKFLFQRVTTSLALSLMAGTEKELADELVEIKDQSDAASQMLKRSFAEAAPFGVDAATLMEFCNKLIKAQAHTADVV